MVGKSQQQEREQAGHTASAVRKHRTKMAGEGDGNTRGSAHRLGTISLLCMNWEGTRAQVLCRRLNPKCLCCGILVHTDNPRLLIKLNLESRGGAHD